MFATRLVGGPPASWLFLEITVSLLRQHSTLSIVPINLPWSTVLAPGQLCSHSEDKKSLGTVIAIDSGQVTVLWSRRPVGTLDMLEIRSKNIAVKSRKLKATWKCSEVEPVMVGNFDALKAIFEGTSR